MPKEHTTTRLPAPLVAEAREEARRTGESFSAVIAKWAADGRTRSAKARARQIDAFSRDLELLCGPIVFELDYDDGTTGRARVPSAFDSDQDREEAWFANRDRLIAEAGDDDAWGRQRYEEGLVDEREELRELTRDELLELADQVEAEGIAVESRS